MGRALPYPFASQMSMVSFNMTKRAIRQQEFDLFVPRMNSLPLKDQREVMERPFFFAQQTQAFEAHRIHQSRRGSLGARQRQPRVRHRHDLGR